MLIIIWGKMKSSQPKQIAQQTWQHWRNWRLSTSTLLSLKQQLLDLCMIYHVIWVIFLILNSNMVNCPSPWCFFTHTLRMHFQQIHKVLSMLTLFELKHNSALGQWQITDGKCANNHLQHEWIYDIRKTCAD